MLTLVSIGMAWFEIRCGACSCCVCVGSRDCCSRRNGLVRDWICDWYAIVMFVGVSANLLLFCDGFDGWFT